MSESSIANLLSGSVEFKGSYRDVSVLWKYLFPITVMLGVVGLCYLSPDTNSETQSGVNMELPDFLAGYIGVDQDISFAEKQLLPVDTEFARKTYHNPQGDRILCSIVLAGGEKRSIHRPEACLPGQGWTIRSGTVIPVALEDGRIINVMDLALSREVETGPGQKQVIRSHYFYFFIGKGVATPYHWKRVFLTSWDRVFHGLNHRWAYVIVSSNVTEGLQRNGKNSAETLEMLKEFTAKVAPYILDEG